MRRWPAAPGGALDGGEPEEGGTGEEEGREDGAQSRGVLVDDGGSTEAGRGEEAGE